MIQHIVLLALRSEYDHQELADIMQRLAALTDDLAGFTSFTHGPNRDFEGKSPDFPYGFICSFTEQSALQSYAIDPRHQALGARLVALCTGGAAGILVADIET
jgi:hypothetical protein